MKRLIRLVFFMLLFVSVQAYAQTSAHFILSGTPAAGTAWAKVGTTTQAEMPQYQSSYSFSHTTGTGTTILIVAIATLDADAVTGVTFNSDALTKSVDSYDTDPSIWRVQIWYLVSPDIGDYTLAFTFSGAIADLVVGATNYSGISTSSPAYAATSTSGTSTSPAITATGCTADDLVYGVVLVNGGTLSTSSTEDWEEYHDADNIIGGGAYKLATTGNNTITWTSGNELWFTAVTAFVKQ